MSISHLTQRGKTTVYLFNCYIGVNIFIAKASFSSYKDVSISHSGNYQNYLPVNSWKSKADIY